MGEVVDDLRSPFTATAMATAHDAARLRHELTAWLAVDVPDDLLDDLVLAAHEAIANAAEHAYTGHGDDPQPIHLDARRAHDRVSVIITDEGTWRTPTGAPFRSRGLAVMHLLIHDVHISRGPTGTVVHLRLWVPCGRRHATHVMWNKGLWMRLDRFRLGHTYVVRVV